MHLIKTGSEATASLVSSAEIDWQHVVALQLWSVTHDRTALRPGPGPGGLSIRVMEAAGVRYGVTVIFADDTWVWIDMAADLGDAIQTVQRLSAQHDKPIRRLGDDDPLKVAGY